MGRGSIWPALSFAISGALAQSAGDVVAFPASGEPQVIHMDGHTKLTLLGTSYGCHHMAPHFERLATANWIDTAPNTTVVWIEEEYDPGGPPIYELVVSDRANTGCVDLEQRQGSFVKPGVSLESFVLTAYPRWDKETILRVKPYRGVPCQEQFILANPAPGPMAQWTPEPLPATKSAGDLEVTLTKLVAGAPAPDRRAGRRGAANDPENQCVRLDFDFRQNGQDTTNWQAWPVETADAAGNWSRGLLYRYPQNGTMASYPLETEGYYFQPGLWPDQPWKVRLEFIQRSNFSDDETVTFSNLPVKIGTQQDWDGEWNAWNGGRTNFPFAITPGTVSGVPVMVPPPWLTTNENSPGQQDVRVIIGAAPGFNPRDMNLTVVAATDDQGRSLWNFEQPAWAGHYSIDFARVGGDIKRLNLKVALHKSRFVEFTVLPGRQ
jgi:hypothetical protein